MDIEKKIIKVTQKARAASLKLATLSTAKKNKILKAMAKGILEHSDKIIQANEKDLKYAKSAGLSSAMQDRLKVDPKRVVDIAASVREVADLPDLIGEVLQKTIRPNGLEIEKVCVPLGVILIIYEARPNVTAECASLCLKTNNVVILRGGKEAFHTNASLVKIFKKILKDNGVSDDTICFIDTTDRSAVDVLLKQNESIHLVIPRGGESLIRRVAENSTIPVIKHYKGICHTYVDKKVNLSMALDIAENAKMQRPSVCNAMETLLVHEAVAAKFLPKFAERFMTVDGVIHADSKATAILKGYPRLKKANKDTYHTEYLEQALSVKVVKDVQEAIDHINTYGSGHTDVIVSADQKTVEKFLNEVDASSVMVNASSRFADGNQYGLGAEIGISTDKIHARGPMGVEGLTTYKYVVRGKGQIRN